MIKGTFVKQATPTGVDGGFKTFEPGPIDLTKTEVKITKGCRYSAADVTELLKALGVRVSEEPNTAR